MKKLVLIILILLPASAFAVDPCQNAVAQKELLGQREAELAAYKTSLAPGSRILLEAQGEINGLKDELEESEKACAAIPTPEQKIAKDKNDIEELKKEGRASEAAYQKLIKKNAPMEKLGPQYEKTMNLEKKIAELQKELDQLTQIQKTAGRVGPIVPGEAPPAASADAPNVETPPSKPTQNTHAAPLIMELGADKI